MGRVCESFDRLRPRPPQKGLADIVGRDIARYDVPPPPDRVEEAAAYGVCHPEPVCEDEMQKVSCHIDPYAVTKQCDNILAGRVPDTSNLTDDRCKVSDPLHQKNKRLCVTPREADRLKDCCDNQRRTVCADYFCMSDALYDAAASNYFRHSEPLGRPTVCQYPFPCKAHCFAPPPRRNPLYDRVAPRGLLTDTAPIRDCPAFRSTRWRMPQHCVCPQASPRPVGEPLQYHYTVQKRSLPSEDGNNAGPRINHFVGTGWERISPNGGRNGL